VQRDPEIQESNALNAIPLIPLMKGYPRLNSREGASNLISQAGTGKGNRIEEVNCFDIINLYFFLRF
jgi:hypothetical protein